MGLCFFILFSYFSQLLSCPHPDAVFAVPNFISQRALHPGQNNNGNPHFFRAFFCDQHRNTCFQFSEVVPPSPPQFPPYRIWKGSSREALLSSHSNEGIPILHPLPMAGASLVCTRPLACVYVCTRIMGGGLCCVTLCYVREGC